VALSLTDATYASNALALLEQKGVTVVVREGKLLAGPRHVLDDDDRDLIRLHQRAMLILLQREQGSDSLRLALDCFERFLAEPDPPTANEEEFATLEAWFRQALDEWRLPGTPFVLRSGRSAGLSVVLPYVTVDDPACCYAYHLARLDEKPRGRAQDDLRLFLRDLRAFVEGEEP
jgi:hypothetical protein